MLATQLDGTPDVPPPPDRMSPHVITLIDGGHVFGGLLLANSHLAIGSVAQWMSDLPPPPAPLPIDQRGGFARSPQSCSAPWQIVTSTLVRASPSGFDHSGSSAPPPLVALFEFASEGGQSARCGRGLGRGVAGSGPGDGQPTLRKPAREGTSSLGG